MTSENHIVAASRIILSGLVALGLVLCIVASLTLSIFAHVLEIPVSDWVTFSPLLLYAGITAAVLISVWSFLTAAESNRKKLDR